MYIVIFSQVVESLPTQLKFLLQILFNICPHIQNGVIVILMIVGASYIGYGVLLHRWTPTTMKATTKKTTKINNCKIQLSLASSNINSNNLRRLTIKKEFNGHPTEMQLCLENREPDVVII